MDKLVHTNGALGPATTRSQEKVRQLAEASRALPQVNFVTHHLLHGGMYTRTIYLPPGTVCTAVLIKPATVLITMGELSIWSNDEITHTAGYNVIPGSAGRKIAFETRSVVAMSMVFPCTATTVEEAQKQFTDEYELLVPLSEGDRHRIVITGE